MVKCWQTLYSNFDHMCYCLQCKLCKSNSNYMSVYVTYLIFSRFVLIYFISFPNNGGFCIFFLGFLARFCHQNESAGAPNTLYLGTGSVLIVHLPSVWTHWLLILQTPRSPRRASRGLWFLLLQHSGRRRPLRSAKVQSTEVGLNKLIMGP